jgi:hypothetical protein
MPARCVVMALPLCGGLWLLGAFGRAVPGSMHKLHHVGEIRQWSNNSRPSISSTVASDPTTLSTLAVSTSWEILATTTAETALAASSALSSVVDISTLTTDTTSGVSTWQTSSTWVQVSIWDPSTVVTSGIADGITQDVSSSTIGSSWSPSLPTGLGLLQSSGSSTSPTGFTMATGKTAETSWTDIVLAASDSDSESEVVSIAPTYSGFSGLTSATTRSAVTFAFAATSLLELSVATASSTTSEMTLTGTVLVPGFVTSLPLPSGSERSSNPHGILTTFTDSASPDTLSHARTSGTQSYSELVGSDTALASFSSLQVVTSHSFFETGSGPYTTMTSGVSRISSYSAQQALPLTALERPQVWEENDSAAAGSDTGVGSRRTSLLRVPSISLFSSQTHGSRVDHQVAQVNPAQAITSFPHSTNEVERSGDNSPSDNFPKAAITTAAEISDTDSATQFVSLTTPLTIAPALPGLTDPNATSGSSDTATATVSTPPNTMILSVTATATESTNVGNSALDGASQSYRPSTKTITVATGSVAGAIVIGLAICIFHPSCRRKRQKGIIWIGHTTSQPGPVTPRWVDRNANLSRFSPDSSVRNSGLRRGLFRH